VSYSLRATNSTDAVFNFLSALGDVAFAYAGHNVVLEIQATMPSTPEAPSKKPMWRGVIYAYIGVAFCYLPVALIGYYIFGNSIDDNILITLERPSWLIATANLFVFVHVIGGYQVSFNFSDYCLLLISFIIKCRSHYEYYYYFVRCNCYVYMQQVFAMPVFDMIETYMVTKLNFPPCTFLRVTTRSLYVGM